MMEIIFCGFIKNDFVPITLQKVQKIVRMSKWSVRLRIRQEWVSKWKMSLSGVIFYPASLSMNYYRFEDFFLLLNLGQSTLLPGDLLVEEEISPPALLTL